MSSIADLIKKQYEKETTEDIESKKPQLKKEKQKKSVVETAKMKRVSLWIDKDAYKEIQEIISILNEDSMANAYANESELIRHIIKKGIPEVLIEFKRMFPKLNFKF